jgi:hypothetical protein
MKHTIIVLCNENLTKNIKPIVQSKFIERFWEKVCSCEYEIRKIERSYNFFIKTESRWRNSNWSNIDVKISNRKLKRLSAEWELFSYICRELGASTEKNVCAILQELANDRYTDMIDLFDNYL